MAFSWLGSERSLIRPLATDLSDGDGRLPLVSWL